MTTDRLRRHGARPPSLAQMTVNSFPFPSAPFYLAPDLVLQCSHPSAVVALPSLLPLPAASWVIPEAKNKWLTGKQRGREDGAITPLVGTLNKMSQQIQALISQLRAHHCYDNGALLALSKLRKRTSQTFSLVLPPFVDEEVLKYLAERCRVRKDEEKLRVQRKREADAEERTRATWARTPGIIYKQVKSNRPAPSEIKRLKGGETANLEDIHQGMLEAWLPTSGSLPSSKSPRTRRSRHGTGSSSRNSNARWRASRRSG